MKTMKAGGRLKDSERTALLESMRRDSPVRAAPAISNHPPRVRDASFESLPLYQQMQTYRAVGETIGLSNPYYLTHQARAGATSVVEGKEVVNFASYDYLGLNGDARIAAAFARAADDYGTSVSASRITAGERPCHAELEAALAAIYDVPAALAFVGGHATAVTTIATLLGPKDLILHDALIHNCIVVGAQLSGAARRSFPHNDLDELVAILSQTRDRFERAMIVTEGLFSMDGDTPDLARLIAIKEQFGCWLMVDDAHGLGVLGARGLGVAEHCGVDPGGVDIWFGTLSKTLVSCGGYIAGSQALIDIQRMHNPGIVYSVGITAPAATAASTAIALMRQEPERVARLQANGRYFLAKARALELNVDASGGHAIGVVTVGDSLRTLVLHQRLLARGVNVGLALPPGVPEKSARIRFFITADHSREHIDAGLAATREELSLIEQQGISIAAAAQQFAR